MAFVYEVNGKVEGHVRERLPAPNFWHLATVGPDGTPQISPMWADLEGEFVMVNTAIGRVKEANLRRNPNVSLSHHDPDNPYDRVEIRGRVVLPHCPKAWEVPPSSRASRRNAPWTASPASTSARTATPGSSPANAA